MVISLKKQDEGEGRAMTLAPGNRCHYMIVCSASFGSILLTKRGGVETSVRTT
jgi:hypothetical protein